MGGTTAAFREVRKGCLTNAKIWIFWIKKCSVIESFYLSSIMYPDSPVGGRVGLLWFNLAIFKKVPSQNDKKCC